MNKNNRLIYIFVLLFTVSVLFLFSLEYQKKYTSFDVLQEELEDYTHEFTQEQTDVINNIRHNHNNTLRLGSIANYDNENHTLDTSEGIFKMFKLILETTTSLEVDIVYKDTFDDLRDALNNDEIDFYPYESPVNETDTISVNSNIFSEDWYVVYSSDKQGNTDLIHSDIDEKLDFFNGKSVYVTEQSREAYSTIYDALECDEIQLDCPTEHSSITRIDSISKALFEDQEFDIYLARDVFDLMELKHEDIQYFKLSELLINTSSGIATNNDNIGISSLIEDILLNSNTSYMIKSIFNDIKYEYFKEATDLILSDDEKELINKVNENGGLSYSTLSNDDIKDTFTPQLLQEIDSIQTSFDFYESSESAIEVKLRNSNREIPFYSNSFIKYEYVALSTKSQQNLQCSELRRNKFGMFNTLGLDVIDEIDLTTDIAHYNDFDQMFEDLTKSNIDNIIVPKSYYLYRTNIEKYSDISVSCSFKGTSNSYFELDFDNVSYLSYSEKEQVMTIFNKYLSITDVYSVESSWNDRTFDLNDLVNQLSDSIYKKNFYLTMSFIFAIGILFYIIHITLNSDRMKNQDFLTSLNNRNLYSKRMSKYDENTIVAFIDVDRFKEINDRHGHAFGDASLKRVADALLKEFNEEDVFRISGDEFVIITTSLDLFTIKNKLYSLMDNLLSPSIIPGFTIESRIPISIGLTDPSITSLMYTEKIVELADSLMYLSKRDTNTKITILNEKNYEKINLSYNISKELKTNKFLNIQPQFQPIFHSKTREIAGYETLSRLIVNKTTVNAGEFIRFISDKKQFDKHMFREALNSFGDIMSEGLFLSINVFKESLPFYARLEPNKMYENIYLEVLEDSVLDSNDIVLIKKIISKGFKIAIDDFGTKNSSISRLNNNYVDLLKIDKSLLEEDNINHDILTFIQRLAKAMELKTVAEGIETKEQLEICNQIDIDYIQGYALSYPLTKEEILKKKENKK